MPAEFSCHPTWRRRHRSGGVTADVVVEVAATFGPETTDRWSLTCVRPAHIWRHFHHEEHTS